MSKSISLVTGTDTTTNYSYNTSNLINQILTSQGSNTLKQTYSFDSLCRQNQKSVQINSLTPYVTSYTYVKGAGTNTTTTLLESIKNGVQTLSYTYDKLGNIKTICENGNLKTSYSYDSFNQLSGENTDGITTTYTYDNGGNITSKNVAGVITNWSYENSNWKDLLTSFNGQAITYDQIGNPLSYRDGMTFTWQNGRQLATVSKTGLSTSYKYNSYNFV